MYVKSPHLYTIGFVKSLSDYVTGFVPYTFTSVAVNVILHWASQILPMPMRLLVKFGMMCPVCASSGRWGMLVIAVADNVISCPVAVLTNVGIAALWML